MRLKRNLNRWFCERDQVIITLEGGGLYFSTNGEDDDHDGIDMDYEDPDCPAWPELSEAMEECGRENPYRLDRR